jgi:thioredoxin-like negative regulator of GroEL
MTRRVRSPAAKSRPPLRHQLGRFWPVIPLGVLGAALAWSWAADKPRRLRARAEAEMAAADWPAALRDWLAVNRVAPDARSHVGEARTCLALHRAAQAEQALVNANHADPADPEPWLARLEILRVEDRPIDAQRVGWEAYAAVPPNARRGVLRAMTLALLADTPPDLASSTLERWIDADPQDVAARVALLRRQATEARDADTSRSGRLAQLEKLLARDPNRIDAREALIGDLADAGEPDRGRTWLDGWPRSARDGRYSRLRGRWDLDFDHRPDRAATELRQALVDLPHDWRTHYRLARALRILGREDEARAEAETLARLRETLEPAGLSQRLDAALEHLDDPRARLDLADLCARAGLTRLAEAWRADAAAVPGPKLPTPH